MHKNQQTLANAIVERLKLNQLMPGLGPEGGRGAPFGNIAERVLRAASSDEFRAWNPETFMCGSGLA
jgi:hypothetical protein